MPNPVFVAHDGTFHEGEMSLLLYESGFKRAMGDLFVYGQARLLMDPPYGRVENYQPVPMRPYFPRGVVGRIAQALGLARGLSWPS